MSRLFASLSLFVLVTAVANAQAARLSAPAPNAPAIEGIAQAAEPPVAQSVRPTTPPPPAAPPQRAYLTQNVRVEVAISDTFGASPVRKIVTVLVGNRQQGRIRSSLSVPMPGVDRYQSIGINVDTTPEIQADGRIWLSLTVQYTPALPAAMSQGDTQKPASIDESMTVILTDGKSTLISQSADPQGDRKVTLEVTATVVK